MSWLLTRLLKIGVSANDCLSLYASLEMSLTAYPGFSRRAAGIGSSPLVTSDGWMDGRTVG